MKASLLALFALFAVVSAAPLLQTKVYKVEEVAATPEIDLCPYCVNFMGQAIDQLLNILLNVGVVGSCGQLCGYLPNQIEQVACNLLCDYVGITAFIDAIQNEDPDPIYICQVLDFCGHVEGGRVNITYTSVSPRSGQQGQTFTFSMTYQVLSPTSVGNIVVVINPPGPGFPIEGGSFTEGQAPGLYNFQASLQTQPTEDDPFLPGLYKVQFAVCAGDCTTNHPYGGVYAQASNSFTITQ